MNTNDAVYTSESCATDYKPEKSIYQDDTRIFHRGGFAYASVAAVTRASFAEGTLTAEVAAPLERIPVFVRAGAVIPRYIHAPQHLKTPAPEEMGIAIYPGESRNPVPLNFNVWLMDIRAEKVQSVREVLPAWEVFERDTLVNLDAAAGVEVFFV